MRADIMSILACLFVHVEFDGLSSYMPAEG